MRLAGRRQRDAVAPWRSDGLHRPAGLVGQLERQHVFERRAAQPLPLKFARAKTSRTTAALVDEARAAVSVARW